MSLVVNLTTSVVVGTHNGEPYIEAQLESILNQTQRIDEVLILDDRSTDGTVEICKGFIKDRQLNNWIIRENDKQLGVFNNFISGALAATGDILFFADQDDIWLQNKVKAMIDAFKANSDILALTTTFSRFDGERLLSTHVKHPHRTPNGIRKIELADFCHFPYYLGMSMAVKKELLQNVNFERHCLQVLAEDLTHDIFLNFVATVYHGHYHLDKVLTKRRSYPQSVSNVKFKVNFHNGIIILGCILSAIV